MLHRKRDSNRVRNMTRVRRPGGTIRTLDHKTGRLIPRWCIEDSYAKEIDIPDNNDCESLYHEKIEKLIDE